MRTAVRVIVYIRAMDKNRFALDTLIRHHDTGRLALGTRELGRDMGMLRGFHGVPLLLYEASLGNLVLIVTLTAFNPDGAGLRDTIEALSGLRPMPDENDAGQD